MRRLWQSRSDTGASICRGVAWPAASYGLPDLGITEMNDVLVDVERITAVTDVPLLVDIDTGWGGAFKYCAPPSRR